MSKEEDQVREHKEKISNPETQQPHIDNDNPTTFDAGIQDTGHGSGELHIGDERNPITGGFRKPKRKRKFN